MTGPDGTQYLAAAVVVGIAALTTCLLVFSPVTSSSVFFWSQLPYHIVALCWIGFALGCLNASSPRRQSAQTSFCGSLTKRLLSTAGFWIYMDALVPWTKLVRHYNNRPPAQTGYWWCLSLCTTSHVWWVNSHFPVDYWHIAVVLMIWVSCVFLITENWLLTLLWIVYAGYMLSRKSALVSNFEPLLPTSMKRCGLL